MLKNLGMHMFFFLEMFFHDHVKQIDAQRERESRGAGGSGYLMSPLERLQKKLPFYKIIIN